MPKDQNLLELNDSKRELRAQLRQALKLTAVKTMDTESWDEVTERVRDALEITEEVASMLKAETER